MNSARHNHVLGMYAAAAALALAAGAARAVAQPIPDDGPVIIGQNRGKYKWWDLQRFTAELELYGEFHHDQQKIKGQKTQVVNDYLIRANTSVSFESYIGHKNLIDMTGNFKLGIEDHTIDSNLDGGDAHETPLVDLYNIEALILSEGPAPVTVYSRRDETRTARAFTTTLTNDQTEHGIIVAVQSDVAPTRLQYFHRELTQSDSVRIDDSSTQDTFSLQSGIKLTDTQRLEVNYEFDHIDEKQGDTFQSTYDRHDGALTHNWDFGSQREHNLRSYFRVYDQTGQFAQTEYRLDENLRLQHSDTLESRYNLTVDDQTYAGTEQQMITGDASVRHKLFDSLITTAHVGGTHLVNPGVFESTEIYCTLLFDYTKKVPFGRVDASLGFALDQLTSSDRTSDTFIINEQHTFNDPFPVVLNHRNIDPGSIVMTNLTSTYTFLRGSDYSVTSLSDRTELNRLLGGPNPPANGQTVLVNYLIGPEPESTIGTFGFNASLRYTVEEGWLAGLSPYVYYFMTDHTLSAANPDEFVIDDVQDIRYGVEYRLGDLSLLAEARNHESTVQPYDEMRAEARYARRLGRDSDLSIELASDRVEYGLSGDTTFVNRALGRWTQRFGDHLDFSVYLEVRDSQDTANGDVQGFEQAIEVHWSRGQTRAFVTFRNGILNGDETSSLAQEFTFGVSRSF